MLGTFGTLNSWRESESETLHTVLIYTYLLTLTFQFLNIIKICYSFFLLLTVICVPGDLVTFVYMTVKLQLPVKQLPPNGKHTVKTTYPVCLFYTLPPPLSHPSNGRMGREKIIVLRGLCVLTVRQSDHRDR